MRAYLGIGSNIEPRLDYLDRAITALEQCGRVIELSPIYETEPLGASAHGWHLNQVVVLDTSLEPDILLASCKQIEQALGRKPYPGYTDREIDIDILLYNDTVLASDELIIPHRALADRNFFLQPLSDVAQLIIEPRSGKTIKQLLDNCPDTLQVKLYEPN